MDGFNEIEGIVVPADEGIVLGQDPRCECGLPLPRFSKIGQDYECVCGTVWGFGSPGDVGAEGPWDGHGGG